ncbi:MAG: GTPase Der [Hyphomicrobiaceae bacterium hypho_1]
MSVKPVIAIIGRPNVGKSTLFNRLTGKRLALVSNVPGLTRDRREDYAYIIGHKVKLIDTAGLEETVVGSIPERMRKQSEQALAKAHIILFIIDARTGIVPADIQFSKMTRRTGLPIVLVANKCEGLLAENILCEAFELGLGKPVSISAEHNKGIRELCTDILLGLGLKPIQTSCSKVKSQFNDIIDIPPKKEIVPYLQRPIKIAVVGRPNSGKSTLINALLDEERMITGPEPGLTHDAISSDFVWKGKNLKLFDTAGLRRKSRIHKNIEKLSASDTIRAIKFADVVILMIDASQALEHQDLTIADHVITEGRTIVIAINKWDKIENKQLVAKNIRLIVKDKLAQVQGVPIVQISALAECGLDKLMNATIAAYDVWNKRIGTSSLNLWLQEAVSQHMPPSFRGRRVRLRYITQPLTRPPTFAIFCSQPDGLSKSYTRYLLNSLRETFKIPGTPIRINIRKGKNPYAKRH